MVLSVTAGFVVVALGTAVIAGLVLLGVFGRSAAYHRPRVHLGAAGPEGLRVQDPDGRVRGTTMRFLIEEKCPSLYKEFRPVRWLFSGHLQTAYSVVGDFSQVDQVEYDRTLLRTRDGGTLGLDFTPPDNVRKLPDDTPVIVVLHGLTGGSHEAYVRAVLAPACAPVEEGGLGYRAIVVNFRGCAGVPVTSPQLYSAGYTGDLRVAMLYVQQRYPNARLLGLGFSLGANVLTRYIAEEGNHCRLAAACVLACPWDLLKNSEALEGNWFRRKIYSKALGSNLQAIVRQHAAALSTPLSHPVAQAVAPMLALRSPTLEAYDDTFGRIAGGAMPPFPFPDARAYYTWASSHEAVHHVHIPFLALCSADDPIVRVLPINAAAAKTGNIVFAVTRRGGHLGWFEQRADGRIGRWFTQPVLEWMRAVGQDMVVNERPVRRVKEVDGFLVEVGSEGFGCKEIASGGRVVGTEGEEGRLAGL